jgi:hypothetical protein
VSEKGAAFLERLWPLVLALVSIGIAYGVLSSRLNQAEATATRALDAIEGRDGVFSRLMRIETKLDAVLAK